MARIRLSATVGSVKNGAARTLSTTKHGSTSDSVAADIEVDFDSSKISSISELRLAFNRFLHEAAAGGLAP